MTTLTQYANASVIAKDDLGKDPSSDWSLQTNDNMTVTGPSQPVRTIKWWIAWDSSTKKTKWCHAMQNTETPPKQAA